MHAEIISLLGMVGHLVHCCHCKTPYVWVATESQAKQIQQRHEQALHAVFAKHTADAQGEYVVTEDGEAYD